MNDIGVSGASSGADILAAAKGARSSKQDDDGKGFLEALTGSRGNGRRSSGTNAGAGKAGNAGTADSSNTDKDAAAPKSAESSVANGLAIDESANAGAGMIDTTAANLAGLAGLPKGAKSPEGTDALSLAKSLIELQKAASGPASADADAAAADPAATMADTGKMPAQIRAAAQLAGIVQQLTEAAAPGGKPVPTDGNGKTPVKGDKDAATPAEDGKAAPTQGGQAAPTISDALSLLNIPQVAVATQGTPATAAGQVPRDAKIQGVALANANLKDDATGTMPAPQEDGKVTDTAQTFRLTRADGRGGALDLSIAKRSDDAADVTVGVGAGGDAQAVTVLDSRRYLGLAANSNSALVAGSLAGDREWSAAMQPGSALSNAANLTSTGKVVNTLKIQLRPDNLGDVTATMRLSGDQLSVDLKVQTGEAYRQLHADQSRMVDALRAQGYQVDHITVSLASNADQQSDSGRQSGSNQSQQQSLPNQGQGGSANPRGQNYSGQQSGGNNGNRSSGERGVEDGAAGGAQRPRSGAVYL
ncbi:chemotaxis motility protein Cellular Process [Rhizobium freirei PRF 81]|uniref:Chemotaxis motility protein Cellular Process n=1 Tax=Rhizobium freirei PRF 81 TaxID=363754 RepID=N6U6N0_9HYPH|nr:flagellar hook-length control protein FliK [Rhizobium freirei]ENN88254.1 chemotaxis motility protein Cellular Process [Rhizobium freirei PRF 81]